MTKLLNNELRINTNTLTLSYVELQQAIEQENKERAYEKFMANIKKSQTKGQVDSLPSYNNLMNKLFITCRDFWEEQYTVGITSKTKKKALWKNLIHPVNLAYNDILEQNPNASNYTTEPYELVPFLVAKEITTTLFHGKPVSVLSLTKSIERSITKSYRMEKIDDNEKSPLFMGVLEFIRSISILSPILDVEDSAKIEETFIGDLPRGNVVMFASDIAKNIINTYDENIAFTKRAFEPMVVKPNKHKNLLDKNGGYLITDSELNKKFYGSNTAPAIFNSISNPNYFKVKNDIQETGYSVNTNLLNFIDSLNTESPELLESVLPYDANKEAQERDSAFQSIKEELVVLKKLEKDSWKDYYALKESDIADKELLNKEITQALKQADSLAKQIEQLMKPVEDAQSRLSKAQANRRTLDIAVKYQDFKSIYLPIFVGANDRVYYYTSDFQPQGNNLCKALVDFDEAERMSAEGFENFKYCFGTMFDGYSKKLKAERIKAVDDNQSVIFDFIMRKSNKFLELLDKDEIFTGISFAIEYFNHLTNPDYKSKVICYIDSCSSAIQIQGLLQHCKQSMVLTSIINPIGDKLEDAYMLTANTMKKNAEEIASLSDEDLLNLIESI